MRIILDGKNYEVDSESIIGFIRKEFEKYLTPDTPEAEQYAGERIAAKMAIRPWIGKILAPPAKTLGVENWRDLKPQNGEDILLTIFQQYMKAIKIIFDISIFELESMPSDDKNLSESDATNSLILTRTIFEKSANGNIDGKSTGNEWIINTTRK